MKWLDRRRQRRLIREFGTREQQRQRLIEAWNRGQFRKHAALLDIYIRSGHEKDTT